MAEIHKSFLKAIGNDVIRPMEFKSWFNSFANGKTDSKDECFDKKPPTFTDLPYEILGEIVGKLDLMDRMRTRKVSRFLRAVVDKQKAQYDVFRISASPNQVEVLFDGKLVAYKKRENECLMTYKLRSKQKVLNGDFLEIALNDLAIVLKKPTIQSEYLTLSFEKNSEFVNEMVLSLLEYLKSPIHVKSLRIEHDGNDDDEFDVSPILSLFKPGTLEGIDLHYRNKFKNANKLIKTDQWKQAKIINTGSPLSVGIEEFLHFSRFDIYVESISLQEMIHLREVLSKSTTFEYCSMISKNYTDVREIGRAFGAVLPNDSSATIVYRHPIPGSNEFLQFTMNDDLVAIKRTN